MHGDFSRRTFQAADHFAAVLFQQGRVQLDADLNEQAEILLHYLRTVVTDLVGPAAAPNDRAGFEVQVETGSDGKITDLSLGSGRMYLDGLLAENDEYSTSYWHQPDGYLDPDVSADQLPQGKGFIAYLRAWEQLITTVQRPRIREIALGDPGPDTATRARVVWQLATLPVTADPGADVDVALRRELRSLHPRVGRLVARARRPAGTDTDPCHLPPEASFRGPENQLYRVEVHSGGPAWPDGTSNGNSRRKSLAGATFTWSRENASVVFPVVSVHGAQVRLATLGRDGKQGLEIGDWVELADDATAARVADDRDYTEVQRARALLRVTAIDTDTLTVTLSGETPGECGMHQDRHPLLRRWDHRAPTRYEAPEDNSSTKVPMAVDGALPIIEDVWIALEDGVEVMFTGPQPTLLAEDQPGGDDVPADEYGATYRSGDYWSFPARTVTGDIEWPQDEYGPVACPPDGVAYHFAALAYIDPKGVATDRRNLFDRLPYV